ncbi:hypothetical protein [Deminuibacter soli]|uniref:Uncharacterized protein n=1 Tax=Deminuibacter soli TaxID=2291815 RepID=A0A3E1NQ43_9BACT|nr:hypothetical protein [Deminuibacter soli]RFM30069.1 hypothetical protein DXN05_03595 [Deminuibacter soli]
MGNLAIQEILLIIVGVAIILYVNKLLIGWYFEIRKRNRLMEAQLKLLGQIAAASNVDKDKIAEIITEATFN